MAATIFSGVRRSSVHRRVATRNMHVRAFFVPSSMDMISSQEVKFERRRWLCHKLDDTNSIRIIVAFMASPSAEITGRPQWRGESRRTTRTRTRGRSSEPDCVIVEGGLTVVSTILPVLSLTLLSRLVPGWLTECVGQ